MHAHTPHTFVSIVREAIWQAMSSEGRLTYHTGIIWGLVLHVTQAKGSSAHIRVQICTAAAAAAAGSRQQAA